MAVLYFSYRQHHHGGGAGQDLERVDPGGDRERDSNFGHRRLRLQSRRTGHRHVRAQVVLPVRPDTHLHLGAAQPAPGLCQLLPIPEPRLPGTKSQKFVG